MWKSFLRENGRWSLKHKIISEEEGMAKTACGWEYDLKLEHSTETDDVFKCAKCLNRSGRKSIHINQK